MSDKRNVWMKLRAPHTTMAVNLASGELTDFASEASCEVVEAKVVI